MLFSEYGDWPPPITLHTATLPSLCEIAADGFALALLGLRVSPKALQFVTIHAHNQALAVTQLERMKSLPK